MVGCRRRRPSSSGSPGPVVSAQRDGSGTGQHLGQVIQQRMGGRGGGVPGPADGVPDANDLPSFARPPSSVSSVRVAVVGSPARAYAGPSTNRLFARPAFCSTRDDIADQGEQQCEQRSYPSRFLSI
jgi:hypothetical protein